MPDLRQVIDAYVASARVHSAHLHHLEYWVHALGERDITAITADDVDDALLRLAERGSLKPRRGQPTQAAGRPLAPASINRYLGTLGGVFKHAKRLRLLPRAHISPTLQVERSPETVDPARYLRPEEVARLLKVARVVDLRWRKLPALIVTAFHTGLRVGNITATHWRDVSLSGRTWYVPMTKNGSAHTAALTAACVAELERLPRSGLVFCGKDPDRPHTWRRLWNRTCEEAGLPGRNFHQLRHGCGSAMAAAGVNQATIMAVLGHRTLTASQRYMHSNVDDRRAAVDAVFGEEGSL